MRSGMNRSRTFLAICNQMPDVHDCFHRQDWFGLGVNSGRVLQSDLNQLQINASNFTGTRYLTVDKMSCLCVMLQRPQLTSEPAWQQIQEYYNKNGNKLIIKDLFAKDPKRYNKFR